MVDLVAVQVDGGGQGDLDLVGGDDRPDQVGPGAAALLGDRQQRRDVVAGVGEVGGQEGVVEVELAHGGAVGPGGPLGRHPGPGAEAEHGRPPSRGWARAWARAAAGGSRSRAATATATSSSTRLAAISATSGSTGTGSAATSASRQASSCSRGNRSPGRWTRTSWSRIGLPYPVMGSPTACRGSGPSPRSRCWPRPGAGGRRGGRGPPGDRRARRRHPGPHRRRRPGRPGPGLTHYVPAPGPWSCARPWPRSWNAPAGAPAPTGWWSPRGQADHVLHHPGPVPGRRRGPLPRPGFPMYESIAAFAGARPVPVPLREANRSAWTRTSWPRW